MTCQRAILLPLLSLLLIVGTGCRLVGRATPTPQPTATPLPPVNSRVTGIVTAEGTLMPRKWVTLAFVGGGQVVELKVQEGDRVTAGQVLAQLDDADAQAAIAVAEAALAQAQAQQAQAQAGPTDEQIAVAQAALTAAQASLAQVVAGPTAEQIAVAQARVNTLKARQAQVQAGARPESIQAALAALKQAENAVAQAQAEYDKVAYAADSDIGQAAALALENATLNYQAALANYQLLVNSPTPEELAVIEAQVAEAEAALAQVQAGPTAEQIAVAQAGVLQAEAALRQAQAGPTDEQIAVAEAGVRQAEAALRQAQLALNSLQLLAPMDGTVAAVHIKEGEIATPGAPAITLADFSGWQVQTKDLTEVDVVHLTEGMPVSVTFDALPGETFDGVIQRISPRAEVKGGDVTYTVTVQITGNADPRLRWGMSAFVEIEVE